jgi:hypothetical protein
MNTLCDPHNSMSQIKFQPLGKKIVEARFNGGTITSDAGALLLREVASAHSLFEDFARCFVDARDQRYTEHTVQELVSQRVYRICLGYEDLNDHDRLRLDPLLATVCGKEDAEGERRRAERNKGKALAGDEHLATP